MPTEGLAALAVAAAAAAVAAAVTDHWETYRREFARLLGRGDPLQREAAEVLLMGMREQLTTASRADLQEDRARLEAYWAQRLEHLLEQDPAAANPMRALVEEMQARLRASGSSPTSQMSRDSAGWPSIDSKSPFMSDSTPSNKVGFTLLKNQVGEVVAQVMATRSNVTVLRLPSMIRVDAVGRLDVIYDEISEAAGEEPGWFNAPEFEESISTHYGRMIHENDRTIMFANPEDAAQYLGFDLLGREYAGATVPSIPSERAAGGSGSDPWAKERTGGGRPNRDVPSRGSVGSGDTAGIPPGTGPAGGPSQARRRYLKGQCPESIPVGKPFSLLVSIVLAGSSANELEPFDVPPEGTDVLLVMHAPGFRLLSDQRQIVHVPGQGDSRPVMFELRADSPGARQVSITAWIGGSYLGELPAEITAERDYPEGPHRNVLAEIATEHTDGAVSLVVRYDPAQNAYRFEFRDDDNPNEVTSRLAYEPGPRVEQLVSGLDELAKGRSGYSADQARDYLVNSGAALWRELIPQALREQFWDRQQRIRQLTILADKDAVPWEILYPRDPGHDAGFLVEQFAVTRAIFGRRPVRKIGLRPARFVLPEDSLPEARAEIDAVRRLIDPEQPQGMLISGLTPLQDLISSGDFGLLHFACHNRFDRTNGSSIMLDNVQFTPTLLTTAAIDKVLDLSAPTIFMNACRSAGLSATYNRLDGWASKFLEAGAGAFMGSLWAVSDGAAREFAQEFYSQFQAGSSLGEAVKQARRVAANQADDPTWLAYAVYGNPRATIS